MKIWSPPAFLCRWVARVVGWRTALRWHFSLCRWKLPGMRWQKFEGQTVDYYTSQVDP